MRLSIIHRLGNRDMQPLHIRERSAQPYGWDGYELYHACFHKRAFLADPPGLTFPRFA